MPNPKLTPFPIVDVGAIADEVGIPLIIDNTMTPLITRPLELGAHVTLHSTSKYICGHGTTVGGVIVDGGTFDWDAYSERFPLMTRPDISHGNIRWLEAARDLPGSYGASPLLLKVRNKNSYTACRNNHSVRATQQRATYAAWPMARVYAAMPPRAPP